MAEVAANILRNNMHSRELIVHANECMITSLKNPDRNLSIVYTTAVLGSPFFVQLLCEMKEKGIESLVTFCQNMDSLVEWKAGFWPSVPFRRIR